MKCGVGSVTGQGTSLAYLAFFVSRCTRVSHSRTRTQHRPFDGAADGESSGRMNAGRRGERASDSRRARLPSVSAGMSFVTKVLCRPRTKRSATVPLIRPFRREGASITARSDAPSGNAIS